MTFARGGVEICQKKYSNGQKLASQSLLVVYKKFDRSSHQTNTFLDQVGIKEDDKNVFNIIENIFFIFLESKVENFTKFSWFSTKSNYTFLDVSGYHFLKIVKNHFLLPCSHLYVPYDAPNYTKSFLGL